MLEGTGMVEPLRVRFGDYELDDARNELRRAGRVP